MRPPSDNEQVYLHRSAGGGTARRRTANRVGGASRTLTPRAESGWIPLLAAS